MDLKNKLNSRQPVFAGWTSIGHPSVTEIMARSGVDFIGIDLEHSTIDQEQAQRIIAACQAAGICCLPRVSSHNGEQIRRLLDSGADGIIVPMVSTPEEVQAIVDWSKYYPIGKRSYGIARAQGYGFDFEKYTAEWNSRSVILIQIESVRGVENVTELLRHEAIDGVMIGPYDLSGSLGIPGQLSHPKVADACARVIDAARKLGKACGTQLVEPNSETVSAAFSAGYTFAVLASDVFLLWKWSEQVKGVVAGFKKL